MISLRSLLISTAAAAAVLVVPASASAAGGVLNSAACAPAGPLGTYFSKWFDTALYGVAPNGTFEAGANGWTLSGASVISGSNTSALAGLSTGSKSLQVRSGGSATSPVFCATSDTPRLRYFAKTTSPTGSIDAELLYRDSSGAVVTKDLGIAATNYVGGWLPASSKPLSVGLPIVAGQTTPVQIRFTATGWNASFLVDDLYIDPYRRG